VTRRSRMVTITLLGASLAACKPEADDQAERREPPVEQPVDPAIPASDLPLPATQTVVVHNGSSNAWLWWYLGSQYGRSTAPSAPSAPSAAPAPQSQPVARPAAPAAAPSSSRSGFGGAAPAGSAGG